MPTTDRPETFPLESSGTITVTEYGLQIHRPLTQEEWQRHMRGLRTIKSAYASALADLTAHGRQQFGDHYVTEAMEQMEFDLHDATRALAIGQIPLDTRTTHRLGSEHAYILATYLTDPADRQKWAATCAKEKLSAHELKASITAGRIMRKDEIAAQHGSTGGITTLQGLRFSFERWATTSGGEDRILKLPSTERQRTLEMLAPFVALAAKIEASLH